MHVTNAHAAQRPSCEYFTHFGTDGQAIWRSPDAFMKLKGPRLFRRTWALVSDFKFCPYVDVVGEIDSLISISGCSSRYRAAGMLPADRVGCPSPVVHITAALLIGWPVPILLLIVLLAASALLLRSILLLR